jgi:hypothetical protein
MNLLYAQWAVLTALFPHFRHVPRPLSHRRPPMGYENGCSGMGA